MHLTDPSLSLYTHSFFWGVERASGNASNSGDGSNGGNDGNGGNARYGECLSGAVVLLRYRHTHVADVTGIPTVTTVTGVTAD